MANTRGPSLAARQLARIAIIAKRLSTYTQIVGLRLGVEATVREFCSSKVTYRQIRPSGLPSMWVRLGKAQSDLRTVSEIWREESYRLPFEASPAVIVDAGANAGYAALWFATMYPSARVIAIEPDAANVDLIRRNTGHLGRVEVIHAALTGTPGTARLVDPGLGPWGLRLDFDGTSDARVVGEVECVTIEDVMARFDLRSIDLLKIDVEGGELEVFHAAAGWIQHVDIVAAELHDGIRPGCTRAFVNATQDFARDFVRGENHFAVRI